MITFERNSKPSSHVTPCERHCYDLRLGIFLHLVHILTRLHFYPICFASYTPPPPPPRASNGPRGRKSLPSQMCGTAVIYERQPFFIRYAFRAPPKVKTLFIVYFVYRHGAYNALRIYCYAKLSILSKSTVRVSRTLLASYPTYSTMCRQINNINIQ